MSTVFSHMLKLSTIERAQYISQHPGVLEEMMAHIGHPNGALRDQVNYRLFMELLTADQIPHNVLCEWASTLPTQLVAFEPAQIFTRSFSALWLTAIVYADRQLQILSEQQYEHIVTAATQLVAREQDLRSFIDEESGWAHSIAHAMDLLVACVEHELFNLRFAPSMLLACKQAMWKGTVFVDDEEERLVRLVAALVSRDMDEDVLVEWLEQLFDQVEHMVYTQGYTPEWFKGRTNTMHFAKTLYFQLKFSRRYDKLRGITSIFIQKWMK